MTQEIEAHKGFRRWFAAGFGGETLPIIPPGAELTPGTTVRPEHRGKTPGVRTHAGTWSGFGGQWSDNHTATVGVAKQWLAWGASVGLQARSFPGLDIDVEDKEISGFIGDLAWAWLGVAPVRVRDNSWRRLVMYARAGEEPIRKVRIAWTDKAGGKQAVELLGHGQQYVVEGPHPKGGDYKWLGDHPCNMRPDGIPKITAEDIDKFFAEVARQIEQRGWGTIASQTTAGAAGTRRGLENAALHAPRPELVLEALAAWANTPEHVATHDDFVQALAAIKAALGADAEEHFGAVEEWALGYDGNDADYVRKTWDSINDAAIGWEWLAGKARAGGFTADAQTDFSEAPAEGEEGIGDTPIDVMCERYVWVQQLDRYIDLETGAALTGRAFNAANTNVAEFGRTGVASAEASFQNAAASRKAAIATYRPGKGPLLTDTNHAGKRVSAVNLWRPSGITPAENVTDADVAPWLEHVTEIFGSQGEVPREHFLNWCAFLFQRPGEKINHALVVLGGQGVGKDTAFVPVFAALGGSPNVAMIKTETLVGQWTHYLLSQVVVVQEMMNFTRRELYNKLKDMTAAPPLYLEVNRKNQNQFAIPNIQNWVIFTNHDDAIALDDDDRRFFVHRSLLDDPKPDAYYSELYRWYGAEGSAAKVAGWLKARDLAAFNPSARPPMTQAKAEMADHALPAAVRYFAELLEEGGPYHGRELVTAYEMLTHSRSAFDASPAVQNGAREKHVIAALRRAGYSAIGVKVCLQDDAGTRKGGTARLWTNKSAQIMAELGGARLRQRYEQEVAGTEARRAGA